VAESLSGDTSVTAVARQHGIGTGQLYAWRDLLLTRNAGGATCFARVEMAGEPRRLTGPTAASGLIEIALPDGTSIRVDAQVDEPALRRVLAALDRR
jgi:transposase